MSAGLAAALRQRLELMLSPELGFLAVFLREERAALRAAFPDAGERRRAIARALAAGGVLDLAEPKLPPRLDWIKEVEQVGAASLRWLRLRSPDPDDMTLREARQLANADRIYHGSEVPRVILDRARADAERIAGAPPSMPPPGLSIVVTMA